MMIVSSEQLGLLVEKHGKLVDRYCVLAEMANQHAKENYDFLCSMRDLDDKEDWDIAWAQYQAERKVSEALFAACYAVFWRLCDILEEKFGGLLSDDQFIRGGELNEIIAAMGAY